MGISERTPDDDKVVSMVEFAREAFAEAVEYHRLLRTHLIHFRARLYAADLASDPDIYRRLDETAAELEEHGTLTDAMPAEEFIGKLRSELVR